MAIVNEAPGDDRVIVSSGQWPVVSGQFPVSSGVAGCEVGRIWLELLPAYAPALSPVEYLWSQWKQHELPNFCPKNFGELSHYARKALCRMRRRPTLVRAFWQQAELFPL